MAIKMATLVPYSHHSLHLADTTLSTSSCTQLDTPSANLPPLLHAYTVGPADWYNQVIYMQQDGTLALGVSRVKFQPVHIAQRCPTASLRE